MTCSARAYDDDQQPPMPVECELPTGHVGPHRTGPFAWPNSEEKDQLLAEARERREAAEARELVLRAALVALEGVHRCVVCAQNPVSFEGATCSPECALRLPSGVPDPVRDAPTRAVPLCARDTLIFDAAPLGDPAPTETGEVTDETDSPAPEVREETIQMWRWKAG